MTTPTSGKDEQLISFYCRVVFKDGKPILIEKLDPFIPEVIDLAAITQQAVQKARVEEWRAILGVDFDRFYPEDRFKDFVSIPSGWINQQISEINMDLSALASTQELKQGRGAE